MNVIITGPTGVGKSYIATALAHKACLVGHSVLYQRLSRLLDELRIARADGSHGKQLLKLSKIHVLVLDDWGLVKMTPETQRDLLEVLDDRHAKESTIVTSQLPIDEWHAAMPDPTIVRDQTLRRWYGGLRLSWPFEFTSRNQPISCVVGLRSI